MNLWTYNQDFDGAWFITSPDGQIVIEPHNTSEAFVRALCHLLNSTPTNRLYRTMDEMDLRGVARCKH